MAIHLDSTCSFAYYNRAVCFQELRDYELVTLFLFMSLLFIRFFKSASYVGSYIEKRIQMQDVSSLQLHFCICILMHIYSCRPHYFSLILKALRDYSITLLLDCKTELELKVLINRGLLYVELSDYSSALQVGQSYKEKEALIASESL